MKNKTKNIALIPCQPITFYCPKNIWNLALKINIIITYYLMNYILLSINYFWFILFLKSNISTVIFTTL